MAARFTFDPEKAAASITFLASKRIPDLTKGKICKLVFLADKHHLVRFGRPVTGDRMCAMKDGPVPSAILNMLNAVLEDPDSVPLLGKSIMIDRRFLNPHFEAQAFELGDFLSESDVEALEATIQKHGAKSFSELRALTHDMPAYINAWAQKQHNSPEMAFEDFFEEDDEAIRGAKEEMIENCKLVGAFARSSIL